MPQELWAPKDARGRLLSAYLFSAFLFFFSIAAVDIVVFNIPVVIIIDINIAVVTITASGNAVFLCFVIFSTVVFSIVVTSIGVSIGVFRIVVFN